jgi:hypothetical protein
MDTHTDGIDMQNLFNASRLMCQAHVTEEVSCFLRDLVTLPKYHEQAHDLMAIFHEDSEVVSLSHAVDNVCFFTVTTWLAQHLRAQDETVLVIGDRDVWVRTTFGQLVYADRCMRAIAANMKAS